MAQNRLLTPAEYARFRVENARDIAKAARNGTLTGATDQVTADFNTELRRERQKIAKLRRMTADEQQNLERPEKGANNAAARANGGQSFNGKQGENRPGYATPVSAANRDGEKTAKDEEGSEELLKFLQGVLSKEDYQRACDMLGVSYDAEADTPDQGEEEPSLSETLQQRPMHKTEREALVNGNLREPAEDQPPEFKGRPVPGGAMDHAGAGRHGGRARVHGLAEDTGFPMSASEDASRRHHEALRQGDIRSGQYEALRRSRHLRDKRERAEAKLANDKRAVEMAGGPPPVIPDFDKSFPDVSRIRGA